MSHYLSIVWVILFVHLAGGLFGQSLYEAVDKRDLAKVKKLVAKGADVNQQPDDYHHTPLVQAASRHDIEMVRYLVENGANVNLEVWTRSGLFSDQSKARGERGSRFITPLGAACYAKDTAIIRYLVSQGADINALMERGHTPLMFTLGPYGDMKMSSLLLELGANVNTKIDNEWTPLMYAVSYHKNKIEMVRELVKHGADVNAKTPRGETALTLAEEGKRTDIAAYLRSIGAKE